MKLQFERTRNRLVKIPYHCCPKMKMAFKRDVIGFGDIDDALSAGDNSVNIFKYDLQEKEHILYPIDFCPFCGSQITIQRVKNVKIDPFG